MKTANTLSLLISLFLSISTYSQIIDLGKCSQGELSEAGFEKIRDIIGEARIVIIGEQNHGVGTDYQSFAFMVKFLHEEMDFNVIAQEYSFFDFGLVNASLKEGGSSQEYRKCMYWPQGKAEENDLLFDYIDAQRNTDSPIYMEGFDPRFFQRKTFYRYFDSLLTQSSEANLLANSQISLQLRALNNVLSYEYKDTLTSKEDQITFFQNMDEIISKMISQSYDPRVIQITKNVKSFAKNSWNLDGYSLTDVDRYYEREFQMADNLIWLSEVMYPNEKIIVRMHNGHAAKNIDLFKGTIPDSLIKKKMNTGSLLDKHFGNSSFHIATTYYSGSYCKWDYKEKMIPSPKSNSIESKLHKKGYHYAFVKPKAKRKFYMFHSEFNSWVEDGAIKAPFGRIFDGIIFIDHVYLPKEKDATNK